MDPEEMGFAQIMRGDEGVYDAVQSAEFALLKRDDQGAKASM